MRRSILLLLLPALAHAQPFQSLEAVAEAARVFLLEQTAGHHGSPEVVIGALDPRLHLAACASPLEAFLPAGGRIQGNTTVGVRCPGPKPWSIYVQASVKLIEQVVVAARPLPVGTVLGPEDVKMAAMDIATLSSGYFNDLGQVVGLRVKRSVGVGVAINTLLLESRKIIRRGDRVTILAEVDGLEVRMAGEALSDGAAGERIEVRNLSSKRLIEAVVAAPGVVKVAM